MDAATWIGLCWAGFIVFTVAATAHQDSRKRREVPGYEEVWRVTSLLPFAAILRRAQSLRFAVRELRPVGLMISAVGFAAVYYFHAGLFGTSPI